MFPPKYFYNAPTYKFLCSVTIKLHEPTSLLENTEVGNLKLCFLQPWPLIFWLQNKLCLTPFELRTVFLYWWCLLDYWAPTLNWALTEDTKSLQFQSPLPQARLSPITHLYLSQLSESLTISLPLLMNTVDLTLSHVLFQAKCTPMSLAMQGRRQQRETPLLPTTAALLPARCWRVLCLRLWLPDPGLQLTWKILEFTFWIAEEVPCQFLCCTRRFFGVVLQSRHWETKLPVLKRVPKHPTLHLEFLFWFKSL